MNNDIKKSQAEKAKKNEIMKDLIHLCVKHKISGFTHSDESDIYIKFEDGSNINIGLSDSDSVEFAHHLMGLNNE